MIRRRRRVPQVVQLTQTECGLCACLMVLRTHGSKETLTSLRNDFEPGRDGLSVRQLRDLLRSRGLNSQMYKASMPGLYKLELPVVIYWENYHFVVLESIDSRQAVIVDPASGRRRIPIDDFAESFSGIVVTGTPNEDFVPVEMHEPNPWRGYLAPLASASGRILAIFALSLVVFGASLTVPLATRALVDEQVAGGALGISWTFALGLAGFAAGLLALNVTRAFVVTSVTVHVGRRTMDRVFGHLLFLPSKYFSARSPGELLYRLQSVNQVRDLMSSQLVQGVLDFALALAILLLMAHLCAPLALVAVAYFLVVVTLLATTQGRVTEALDAEMSQSSKSQSMQLEAVVAMTALKLSGSERRFLDDWRTVYERALTAIRRRAHLQAWINGSVTVAQVLAPVTVLVVGLHLVETGQTSVGTVVAVQSVASTFFGLASSIFSCYTMTVQAGSYLHRLADITRHPTIVDEGTVTSPIEGSVTVSDVSFRYSMHAPDTLHHVDLVVRPGEKVAIVGPSGSGKSTLGKLLCGLFEPTEGEIRYDGRELREYPRDHFYRAVGYVPQEVHLLNRTVLENITMGDPHLGEDDVRLAAGMAQIAADIQAMPMQYQTLVSEMGGNFSGGQRQRMALARALVRRPRLLILDEATSSLDTVNEARITQGLADASCTIVVIAHRLSTVRDADRIYVMAAGRIVQSGDHASLAATDGPYRDLFSAALNETG